ncbi:hypothetical protein FOL47_007200 [Perkinsus chesapeaki]|uniref:Nuclease S1 n=1 Tax=Perkinsus chesapeaki TaxID=330153 RepID=A0A7J6LM25_PERCH|nr:hypothetical protein FOL47_007200 [Perkinsus chesapeaki]
MLFIPLLAHFISLEIAFGSDAHAIVAELADLRMADKTRQEIYQLFGNGYRLSHSANWPDTPWTPPLHHAYTSQCTFNYASNCVNDQCVAGAIRNYTNRMIDPYLANADRLEAVKYLVHFVTDAHLPMNAGRSSDQGGKGLNVHINFADFSNVDLGKVWEEKLLDEMQAEYFPGTYVQQDGQYPGDRMRFWRISSNMIGGDLDTKYAGKIATWLSECQRHGLNECVNNMLSESAGLACNIGYKNVDGREIQNNGDLPREYYTSRIEVLREQLAKSAARLTWVLDNAFFNYSGVTTTPRPVTTTGPNPSTSPGTPTTTASPSSNVGGYNILIPVLVVTSAYALL